MSDAVISGLFSLLGAILGAGVSILIYSKSMKKSLQHEIQKINYKKEADLSIRLFDKKEAYLAELLAILSMVRNVALDILEFWHTDETILTLRQSNDAASSYLNAYEKRNILYVPKCLRHEAAHILHAWRSFNTDVQRVRNTKNYMECYSEYIREIERLVEAIKLDIGRG